MSATPATTAWGRATGAARYTADRVPNDAVLAALARSPHAHARVSAIDSRAALAVPGVLSVLTPADFEGVVLGHQVADEPVLTARARYVGDGVAAVAAEDAQSLALGIAALVIDYEVLPHALCADEALALGTPIHESCPDNVTRRFLAERGDWQAAAARVAHWVEGTFETQAVQHAYLEPRATLARFRDDRLELVTGTHFPAVLAEHYAPVVERWGTRLEIVTPDIGGSFGAKWEHPTHLVCLAFAERLRRDVAMVLSRRDDMIGGRTRLAMRMRVRLGASADGELIARETEILADNGAYSGHGPTVMLAAATRMDNVYRFSAVRAQARLVYTNNMPSECFRGFGSPQSVFANEQLVDELARRLRTDPVVLRRANATRAGDTTIHGWRVGSCGLDDCLAAIASRIDEHKRAHPPHAADEERHRVGYGIAAGAHCISNRGYDPRFDRATVKLDVEPGGALRLSSGEVEIGCGTVELLADTVSRELALERKRLQVVLGDTASGPYGLGSFASRTSFFAGHAAIEAARRFGENCARLAPALDLSLDVPVAAVIDAALARGRAEELAASATYEPRGVEVPDKSAYGNISPAYTFTVHGCRVRVDTLTGKVTVDKYWAAHDAGAIVNPSAATGQAIGAIAQGLGFALAEAQAVDSDGRLLNPGYLDDRVATFPDAVPVEVIFAPTYEEAGPHGAKTIAELPIIPVAGCVANAVHDAIGVRQHRLPMTPERVWRTLRSATP